jgi:ribosomal protein L11 methyltransferase
VLDVGSGSGILGIAAAKKGAIVSFCDTDQQAVEASLANYAINAAAARSSWVGSVGKVAGNYHFVIANIVADVLIAAAGDLTAALKENGVLIISGILERCKSRINEAFGGLDEMFVIGKGEWLTFAYRKQGI